MINLTLRWTINKKFKYIILIFFNLYFQKYFTTYSGTYLLKYMFFNINYSPTTHLNYINFFLIFNNFLK